MLYRLDYGEYERSIMYIYSIKIGSKRWWIDISNMSMNSVGDEILVVQILGYEVTNLA